LGIFLPSRAMLGSPRRVGFASAGGGSAGFDVRRSVRGSIRRSVCGLIFFLAGAGGEPGGRSARAEEPGWPAPPAARAISTDGACPASAALTAAMTALIPRGDLAALPRGAAIAVFDLGESYRVEVVAEGARRTRVFRDAGRDCQQRARFAAVFIVLTLLPPELVIDAPSEPLALPPAPPPPTRPAPPSLPSPPSPSRSPPPVSPPSQPVPRRFRLELAALLDAAPAVFNAPAMLAPGLELRAARRFGGVAGVAAVGLEPRARFSVGGLDGREARIPIDLGVRLQRAAGPVEFGGELGLAAAIFRAQGLNTAMPQQGTRLDLGARAGVALRLGRPQARVAPFAGLHALLFPWPYQIATTPRGSLGATPALWVGATLGLSASL
jgi:hypothetical protein